MGFLDYADFSTGSGGARLRRKSKTMMFFTTLISYQFFSKNLHRIIRLNKISMEQD